MKTLSLKNISELPSIARAILDFAESKLPLFDNRVERRLRPEVNGVGRIFCFYGELGAGKTTLIKELCRQLGVADAGSSPTFSLVNEYHPSPRSPQKGEGQSEIPDRATTSPLGRTGGVIYHFDLYRLKSESEIYDLGYEDYIFSNSYCFIEWPEKIEKLLPENVVVIRIEVKDSERLITME